MSQTPNNRDLVQDVRDLLRREGKGASIAPAVDLLAKEVAALQSELAVLRATVSVLSAQNTVPMMPKSKPLTDREAKMLRVRS